MLCSQLLIVQGQDSTDSLDLILRTIKNPEEKRSNTGSSDLFFFSFFIRGSGIDTFLVSISGSEFFRTKKPLTIVNLLNGLSGFI
jgi:hypothetical protein